MDRLSLLLHRYPLTAVAFYAGAICGVHSFARDNVQGHLHVVRRGPAVLVGAGGQRLAIAEPCLIFFPRPDDHRLMADEREGADVVCATVRFGGGGRNPIADSLPYQVLVPLADMPGIDALVSLVDYEAFDPQCGQQAALDRLCELMLIRLLRHCLRNGLAQGGALAGLADERLSKALTEIHAAPERNWDLPRMAALAGMSRARFASQFRRVTGDTPANYLANWRMALAQTLLRRGHAIKQVAGEVGYASQAALTRAFVRKVGQTPSDWIRADRAPVDSWAHSPENAETLRQRDATEG